MDTDILCLSAPSPVSRLVAPHMIALLWGTHGLLKVPVGAPDVGEEAAVVLSAVIVMIMAVITAPICAKIHISHGVSITSWGTHGSNSDRGCVSLGP